MVGVRFTLFLIMLVLLLDNLVLDVHALLGGLSEQVLTWVGRFIWLIGPASSRERLFRKTNLLTLSSVKSCDEQLSFPVILKQGRTWLECLELLRVSR